MKTKPTLSAKTAGRRGRADAELRELGDKQTQRPMKAKLYRTAEAEVRKQEKKSKDGVARVEVESQRLLHELQVHQIELEMQNSELQEARDRMEVLLEKYTDLYDFAPAGYFNLTADGTIQHVNLFGAKLTGIERSRLLGQSFERLVAAGQRAVFHAFLKQVFSGPTERSIEVEFLNPRPPLPIVCLRAQRAPTGLDCRVVMVDITALKREEEKVRVSEIRYRRLFEMAHDGVLLLDPDTRKITDANPFMTKLLGYSHAQLVGMEMFEIGLLKDKSASQENFQKLKYDREVRYEDLPLENRNGRHQEVEVVANLYQEDGRAVIQCNIRDITARKQAEAAQRRSEVLAASNLKLKQEIARRLAKEKSLKQSDELKSQLLEQSRAMQEQLRHLSRHVLQAQEEERKRISRELHDVIAQTLAGVNVRLAALKMQAATNTKGLDRNIAATQRLVEHSVNIVHQFARDLRPTVLDDLGLISALHSYLKHFNAQTGIRAHLKAFADVQQLDVAKQTVFYRVAQEALTNVARHAEASRVEVSIKKLRDRVGMKITDNGKSFPVQRVLHSRSGKHLGLLGMRERVEMVGGSFNVESAPGKGTTIVAQIPFTKKRGGGGG